MKKYVKPQLTNNAMITGIAPALAVGAALAGGYVVGRVVKAVEIRVNDTLGIHALREVAINNG